MTTPTWRELVEAMADAAETMHGPQWRLLTPEDAATVTLRFLTEATRPDQVTVDELDGTLLALSTVSERVAKCRRYVLTGETDDHDDTGEDYRDAAEPVPHVDLGAPIRFLMTGGDAL